MKIDKIRFIEPCTHVSERKRISPRNPSLNLLTLTTAAKSRVPDTMMYSECISAIRWDDVLSSDVIFIEIPTPAPECAFSAAEYVRENSNAMIVVFGIYACLNFTETLRYCDYILLGECDDSILTFLDALKFDRPMKFEGLAYFANGKFVHTGSHRPPTRLERVPDRQLLYNYRKLA
ncbi:MAG: B12-binding domain-containing radical SAM protein, partial [Oscillospiraceae bacterium]|nr:B12-binding domain-containing radical SAM protein [Oscillospiraceae bacterium]